MIVTMGLRVKAQTPAAQRMTRSLLDFLFGWSESKSPWGSESASVAQFPHLLAICTRHRLTVLVVAVQSGWRVAGEDLYRSPTLKKQPTKSRKVYCAQRSLTAANSVTDVFKGPLSGRVVAQISLSPSTIQRHRPPVISSLIYLILYLSSSHHHLISSERDKIRLLVSRRYTTRDATQFRDAWAPHTQTRRHGELAMMIRPYEPRDSLSIYILDNKVR